MAAEPAPHRTVDGGAIDEGLRAIAHFTDLKSRFTRGHSSGVAALAGAAAQKLGLDADRSQAVLRAGLVHDVGRVAVTSEVKRLERETGLAVRYVLSPGGGHHVLMPPWVEAFPNASVLVGPTRIPRTASGKKLLAMPRVATFDPDRLLPQFAGQLELVSFRGLFGAPDHVSPGEGGRDGFLMMLNLMFAMMFKMKDPVDELWAFHVPTRTLIGGENLGWMYPKETHAKLPRMVKGMVTPESVYLFKDARKVADAKLVDACWRAVLKWPASTVLTYHDPAGHGFHGDGRAAIEAAARANGQLLS